MGSSKALSAYDPEHRGADVCRRVRLTGDVVAVKGKVNLTVDSLKSSS